MAELGVGALLKMNKLFKPPAHPFNLQSDGVQSYAMWQYERGADTIAFFLKGYRERDMFFGKTVLDIGCGAGGKTMFYASRGVKKIVGMDIVPRYEAEANALARDLGYADRFSFVLGDAANTAFEDGIFDTIIMNDAMEHIEKPEAALAECARILKKGGRLFVNFPPYNHPFGAHLSDVIAIPWVHVFFSDQTLIEGYKKLCENLPDGKDRVAFRISRDGRGKDYFSYINKMTLKRFSRIKKNAPLKVEYYAEAPLRRIFTPLAKLPVFKEYFVKMAVCVFVKE